METQRSKHPVEMALAILMALSMTAVCTRAQQPSHPPAGQEAITRLIRDLGDPSYAERTDATRRLCVIGMPAAAALERAADGKDVEVALRAKAVLRVVQHLMFSGVDIQLSFSKQKIDWDEPVDLTIKLTNRSVFPARVPFDIGPAGRGEVTGDARQVADMLDVAEYVRVTDPRGTFVDLTVDDIIDDASVAKVVQQRVDVGPTTTLAPGQTATVTARAFNRGWSRFKLLDAGAYTLLLDYIPDWQDDWLAAQRAGRVVSNTVRLTVVAGAPPSVSRRGIEAGVAIERDDAFFVAQITNRSDQTILINKNFGAATPFARGHWVFELGSARHEVPFAHRLAPSWHDFDPAKLISLPPGETTELSRVRGDALRRSFAEAGALLDNTRWTLHFEFDNLCDRKWQRRQGTVLLDNPSAPNLFQKLLPRHILTNRQVSVRLPAPLAN